MNRPHFRSYLKALVVLGMLLCTESVVNAQKAAEIG